MQAHWSERGDLEDEGLTVVKRLKVQCYSCQELGIHLSQDYPKPKANRVGSMDELAILCQRAEEWSLPTGALR